MVENLTKLFVVRKGLSGSNYVLSDYRTKTNVMNLFFKTEIWVLPSRSKQKLSSSTRINKMSVC